MEKFAIGRRAIGGLILASLVVIASSAFAQLSGQEIHIGVGAPLTTGSATFGVEMRQAIDLAVAERNAAGGVLGAKIVVDVLDDEANNAKGETVAKAFCEKPSVLGLLGHVNSGVTIAASKVYAGCGLPMITPMSSNPAVTDNGLPNVFRLTNRDDHKGPGLAAYLIEGRGSKDFATLKRMMYCAPEVLRALLARLTEMTVAYLNAQIEAGAQVVQLFDTWAGLLSPADYALWVQPCHREIASKVERTRAPLILYVNNGAHVLDAMLASGADVLSLDWRVDMAVAARRAGGRASLQGNLDPCALAAPAERIGQLVREIADAAASARGHVLNLGHGVLPETPVAGVRAFVEAAKALPVREPS